MNKKISVTFIFFLMICLLFSSVHALYASWNGYVYINGSLASSGTIVTAHINNASAAAATTSTGTVVTVPSNQSYYIIDLECAPESNVSLKVWGIWSNVVDQTCTGGWHTNGTSYFNLSISILSNGNTCTYAGGCTSGFCVDGYCCNEACSGASEDCNVAGHLGTCTSTAAPATTVPGGGGGGGGVATTTIKITTTTAVASVTTTAVPSETTSILATTTTTPEGKPKPGKLEISEIPTQVIGVLVGVVAIISLVVFILIRFHSIKMKELKRTAMIIKNGNLSFLFDRKLYIGSNSYLIFGS
jgi:hypothetical protein